MKHEWNGRVFDSFVKLRNDLRDAKRNKNYQNVLLLGQEILAMESSAMFLDIFFPIFLKDMGNACLKLKDFTNAKKYFLAAILGYKNQPGNWEKEITIIENKLRKLG